MTDSTIEILIKNKKIHVAYVPTYFRIHYLILCMLKDKIKCHVT